MDKEEIRLFQNNQKWLDNKFIEFCKVGDLDSIRYMLTSPDLILRPDFSHNEDDGYDGLTTAAANGHLNVVDYLLFSPDLEKHDCFPTFVFDHLILICEGEHYHVADFLVEKKIFRPEYVFVAVHEFDDELDKLTHYLVLNCDIKKTPKVQEIIDRNPEIAKLFNIRDLNKELREELVVSDVSSKRIKL